MPADGVFGALAAADDGWRAEDVDASGAMAALLEDAGTPPPLWAEAATKAFVGDASFAHLRALGHRSRFGAVPRPRWRQADRRRFARRDAPTGGRARGSRDDDDERVSTAVPTHRPLRAREAALLGDDDVSVACVLPGDLCVFSSAALHFASNGAGGVSAALFHGIVTDPSLPRLVEAARRGSGGGRPDVGGRRAARDCGPEVSAPGLRRIELY